MIQPGLTRFDSDFYKDQVSGSPPYPQVPCAGAVLEFYAQGATVSQALTFSETTATVKVHDQGAIRDGSIVRVGPGNGSLLRVTKVKNPNEIILARTVSGDDFTLVLEVGVRLFVMTGRPSVFADVARKVPLGSSLVADASGRAAGYVAAPRFDYVVCEASPPSITRDSEASVSNHGALVWNHGDSGGTGKLILVGVSWFSSGGTQPGPPDVTYGLVPMKRIAASTGCAVYVLANPPASPPGSSEVRASFSLAVGATGGAMTLEGADLIGTTLAGLMPVPPAIIATGSGTSASTAATGTNDQLRTSGLLLDTLAITDLPLTATTVPDEGAGQVEWWNNPGASTAGKVVGAGSTKVGVPDQALATNWSWPGGPSAPYGLATVSVSRRVLSSHIDAVGGTVPSPSWINVLDPPRIVSTNYPNLQGAIDALPATGGEVFIPGGSYLQAVGLLINKDGVTLRGEGPQATIIKASVANPSFDLLRVDHARCVIRDLQIDGNATQATAGKSCLVLGGPSVTDCRLDNLLLQNASKNGLLAQGVVSLLAMSVVCKLNKGAGVVVERTIVTPWNICLIACSSDANAGRGVVIQPGSGTSVRGDNVMLLGCGLTRNEALTQGNALQIIGAAGVQVMSCYFEWAGTLEPSEFIYCDQAQAATIDGCTFQGRAGATGGKVKRGVTFVNSSGASLINNVGTNLADYLAHFDALTLAAAEYCNREGDPGAPFGRPRFGGSIEGLFGLSGGAMKAYQYATVPTITEVQPGAMVWVGPTSGSGGDLYVYDGSAWRKVHS